MKKFDSTDLKIALLLGAVFALAVVGITFEALKFAALVKYVLS